MPEPHVVAYSRNGFVGPFAFTAKPDYIVDYKRVAGSYAPRRFDPATISAQAFADPRMLPVPILRDCGDDALSVELSIRTAAMPFGVRNVFADEVHVVTGGAASLETEFGVLSLVKDDIVLIPRAISYRIVDVRGTLTEWIAVSRPPLSMAMAPGFGPLRRMDSPSPYADPISRQSGEYELVIRHGDQLTSVFYEFDPVPGTTADGPSPVCKFNLDDLCSIDLSGEGLLLPPKIIADETDANLFYDLSARKGDRPSIHYNADFDELGFFLGGSGAWGDVSVPGALTHIPKGFPHQGPIEDVPEGYKAVLLETRQRMTPTAAGLEISRLMETNQFGVHPSAAAQEV